MEVREPITAYGKKTFTIAEYLEMETAATEKSEYYQGEIFAMSGAKLTHNIISGNMLAELGQRLKDKSCRPFNSDMRVHIKANTCLLTLTSPWFVVNRKRLMMMILIYLTLQ